MTLEEFMIFAEEQIQKQRLAKRKEAEAQERRLSDQRFKGTSTDFIDEEDGHYVVVKGNKIVERCDTKAEAWRALYAQRTTWCPLLFLIQNRKG